LTAQPVFDLAKPAIELFRLRQFTVGNAPSTPFGRRHYKVNAGDRNIGAAISGRLRRRESREWIGVLKIQLSCSTPSIPFHVSDSLC